MVGVNWGFCCSNSAATAAAWGAAADVPQNRQWLPSNEPKYVLMPQCDAVMFGLASTFGVGNGAAGVVPTTGPYSRVTGPREE